MTRVAMRRWRAPISLAFGVPLMLGSTPAAAASSGALVLGGVTTGIGLLAATWALLLSQQSASIVEAAAFALVLTIVAAAAVRSWRERRSGDRAPWRFGAADAAGAAKTPEVAPLIKAATTIKAVTMIRAAQTFESAQVPDAARPFETAQLLDAARVRFLRLQAAWDAGDVQALGSLTTPDMLAELLDVLMMRGVAANRTDVITLHAELLALEELGAGYLASIEFSGLICESAAEGVVPFRELWMLRSDKHGQPSWRLARQLALL